mmetsp:Transcript_10994/g.16666  ORF Transcript_10994/g.16666 Transcript_10994/m.16666 type:complete len:115 (-) Transcript_10994:806-1150(-)|eukprot:CAMPEP_0170497434 /NCGR_PEP_ID=MMETSP0208-20121228/24780_1 /TAXON_ID=197538 /ORGANISM="Strombidium inclinatum, Strain S3" /LENGTH=114 /DNA_ID=CAMNT_0010774251 /DNA_START=1323 /DNA_END=1667 /DNA_ORIENTATION=-
MAGGGGAVPDKTIFSIARPSLQNLGGLHSQLMSPKIKKDNSLEDFKSLDSQAKSINVESPVKDDAAASPNLAGNGLEDSKMSPGGANPFIPSKTFQAQETKNLLAVPGDRINSF